MGLAEQVALGELSLLPASANNVSNCNSLPFTQDALATDGDRQYAIWVSGPERAPLIAQRALPDGEWSQPVDLQRQPGSPFELPTKLDPHHSYALGVDALGRVHVAGNLHNAPLRYMRSEPGDLKRWSAEPMIGEEEASVTYPAFVSLPDGTLLFFFRDGRAGFGDAYLNRLPPDGCSWERLGMLVEGRSTGESPYLNHIAVSAAGDLHVSGCFREQGGRAASNRDVWHALSVDGGRSWRSAAGEPLELPLGHGSVPIAVATASSGSGLVNQTGMDVDPAGNPHIAFFRYDGSGATQIVHAWHAGGGWQTRDVTDLTHRMDTETPIVDASVARPAVACLGGEVWAILRAAHDGYGGRAVCLRCTPGEELREIPIHAGDLGTWEPSLDTAALRQREELHLPLTLAPPYDAERLAASAVDWADQPIGVLSLSGDEFSRALERG